MDLDWISLLCKYMVSKQVFVLKFRVGLVYNDDLIKVQFEYLNYILIESILNNKMQLIYVKVRT